MHNYRNVRPVFVANEYVIFKEVLGVRMNRYFNWKVKGANQENPSLDRGLPRYSNLYEYLYSHMKYTLFALLSRLFKSFRHPFIHKM